MSRKIIPKILSEGEQKSIWGQSHLGWAAGVEQGRNVSWRRGPGRVCRKLDSGKVKVTSRKSSTLMRHTLKAQRILYRKWCG